MDQGTQYAADDFLKQIEFWGIEKSLAFIGEPQTNGVAERFNRAVKEPSSMAASSATSRKSVPPLPSC